MIVTLVIVLCLTFLYINNGLFVHIFILHSLYYYLIYHIFHCFFLVWKVFWCWKIFLRMWVLSDFDMVWELWICKLLNCWETKIFYWVHFGPNLTSWLNLKGPNLYGLIVNVTGFHYNHWRIHLCPPTLFYGLYGPSARLTYYANILFFCMLPSYYVGRNLRYMTFFFQILRFDYINNQIY